MEENASKAIWLHFVVLTSLLTDRFNTASTDPLAPTPLSAEYIQVVKVSSTVTIKGDDIPDLSTSELNIIPHVLDITEDRATNLYLHAASDSFNYDSRVILYNVQTYEGDTILERNGNLLFFEGKSTITPVSFNPLECRLTHRDFWFYHNKIFGTGTGYYGICIAIFQDDGNIFGYFELKLQLLIRPENASGV